MNQIHTRRRYGPISLNFFLSILIKTYYVKYSRLIIKSLAVQPTQEIYGKVNQNSENHSMGLLEKAPPNLSMLRLKLNIALGK